VIRLENIYKSFGQLEVLRGVSLNVARGEVVVVIGPSGSGKSTLLRVMNYLEPYQKGTIYLDGQPIYQRYDQHGHVVHDPESTIRAIRARIGMVSQRFNLFPHMSVLQNIMTGPVNVRHQSKSEAEKRARTLLISVGLADKINAYPGQLSGGQQQRVAIARALAMDPEAMLFDEVTSALDPRAGWRGATRNAPACRRRYDDGGGHSRDGLRAGGRRPRGDDGRGTDRGRG